MTTTPDIHDSIDAEFDMIIPPQAAAEEPQVYDPEPEEEIEPDYMNIDIPIEEEIVVPTPVPEKGLTAWLYHMHLKTKLSMR